ncbi:MAG: YfhO family protein [Candidatus Hydrogenedentes bacterium]|nr:YfhO family protein [Candidatus Hydrogenedentota bacterium]
MRRQSSIKELLGHAALLLLILCAVFPRTMLLGEMVHPGGLLFDTAPWSHHAPPGLEQPPNWVTVEYLTCFHSFYTAAKLSLQESEWPLWNPYEFSGMPLLANYQSTVFYPPRLLHMLLDVAVASTILMILKFWLCGMTAYLYGRGIGLGIWASRFLSVAWMLSSYNLIWCYWPIPDVSAWLPLLMLGIERLVQGRTRKGFATLVVATTLLLLAGHPETAFVAGLGAGMYLVCRVVFERRRGKALWTPLVAALAAWAPAILLLSALLLPFGEYLFQSQEYGQRSRGLGESHAFNISSAIAMFIPRYFGAEADNNRWGDMVHTFQGMMYAGLVVWLGIFLLFSRRSGNNARVAALLIPAAGLFALAFNIQFLQRIHALPVMSSMWQCYFTAFPMFAMPVLAAIGLDRFLSERGKARHLVPPLAALLLGALIIVGYISIDAGLLKTLQVADYVHGQIIVAALTVALGTALLCVHCLWQRATFIWAGLILLLVFDLVYATRDLRASIPRSALLYETPLLNYLQNLEQPARVNAVSGGILPGFMLPYGIEEHWGHDGIYPRRIVTFYGRLGENIWTAMEPACAITHYLRKVDDPQPGFPFQDSSRFRLATTLDGIEVYENLRALPRAYLVANVESISGVDALFDRMSSPAFDPAKTALVETPINFDGSEGAVGGSARIVFRTSTRVHLDVNANKPAVLILADAYYPGWKATVNGTPTEIFPVNHTFRGIVVPSGAHRVEFTYFPTSFKIGLSVSIMAMLIASCLAIILLLRASRPARVSSATTTL